MTALAIVGYACLFPGAPDADAFWRNLEAGIDSRTEGGEAAFPGVANLHGGAGEHRILTRRGGFIEDFKFDPAGFKWPAERFAGLDDLFLWTLSTARDALSHAGRLDADGLDRTGLVLGNYCFPTPTFARMFTPAWHAALGAGLQDAGLGKQPAAEALALPPLPAENVLVGGLPAHVAAQALGLGGVRFALDAACSSALYAIRLAGDYLASGRADTMLAGGVCAADPTLLHLSFSNLQAYPRDGALSQPLDAGSTGILTGQGAAFMVLRRLEDAERDGDTIHAVIRSTGIGNDGAGRHLLVPHPAGQLRVYADACARAGIDPADVNYVECHATGTPIGDRTEIGTLADFYGQRTEPLAIGSAKGHTGHLLTVAGMASLLKVVLAMKHGLLPATPGVGAVLTPSAGPDAAVRVVTQNRAWDGPKVAGVSAFGFGGTNAHLIVSERSTAPETNTAPVMMPVKLAVTGIGARFGALDNLAALRDGLAGRSSARRALPEARLRGFEQAPPLRHALGIDAASTAPEAGYIERIPFDALGNRVPPAELGYFNQQQALLLDVASAALEDAGFSRPAAGAAPRAVAVIVALDIEPRQLCHLVRFHLDAELDRLAEDVNWTAATRAAALDACRQGLHAPIKGHEVLSYIANIAASRVASTWNFCGPAFTVSSDRSAFARVLEAAALLAADPTLEAVVVAAVDLACNPEPHLYDTRSGGLARACDGAGALVLLRQENAGRSYAVIEHVAFTEVQGNADGSFAEATQESAAAGVVGAALRAAGRRPEEVGLLELNAPALPGWVPPLAAGALSVLIDGQRTQSPLALTETAARLGDAGVASLAASLIGTILALSDRVFPDAAGSAPAWAAACAGQAYLPQAGEPWLKPGNASDRVALVAAGGICGTHAAIVVSDAGRHDAQTLELDWQRGRGPCMMPISATDPGALAAALQAADAALVQDGDAAWIRLLQLFKTQAPVTGLMVVLVADDVAGLRREIVQAQAGIPAAFDHGRDWSTPSGSFFTPRPQGNAGKLAFVYPGAFTGYPGLGRGLFELAPALLTRFENEAERPDRQFRLDRLFPRRSGPADILEKMGDDAAMLDDIPAMLSIGTNHAILTTALLRDGLGLVAQGAVGYSLGESTMMFASGAWSSASRDERRLDTPLFSEGVCGRKELVRQLWDLPASMPDDAVWSSWVVRANAATIRERMSAFPRVVITHINSPIETVCAGDPGECHDLIVQNGWQGARLPVSHVMHCAAIDTAFDEMVEINRYPTSTADGIERYSALHNDRLGAETDDEAARRIAVTLIRTVDFAGLIEAMYRDGYRTFIEIGPAATCSRWIDETLGNAPHIAISSDRRGQTPAQSVARVLARLMCHRIPVCLDRLRLPAPAMQRPALLSDIVVGAAPIPAGIVARLAKHHQNHPQITVKAPMPAAIEEEFAVAVYPSRAREAIPALFAMATPPEARLVEIPASEPVRRPAPSLPALPVFRPDQAHTEISRSAGRSAADIRAAFADQARRAHRQFLDIQVSRQRALLDQMSGVSAAATAVSQPRSESAATVGNRASFLDVSLDLDPGASPAQPAAIFDQAALLAFATGNIADVFGPRFAVIDSYAQRVRLPSPPYHFVTRVTALEAEPASMKPGRIVTEYDVPLDAWYLLDGQVPPSITIEAGQADMLLASYLGVDFINRGERVYRLLDSTLAFYGALPLAGQRLRYEIEIKSFVRNGEQTLFFFNYLCFADDVKILALIDACAGFFTQEELDTSLGIVLKDSEKRERAEAVRGWFKPVLRSAKTQVSQAELQLIGAGRIDEVFGPAYRQPGCNPSLRLPAGPLLMIDEITEIDRSGGPWGLGKITAIKRLLPDAWYFTCHFQDDPVLAGSLAAEGAVQVIEVFALWLGLQMCLPDARFEPVTELRTKVCVRGQITPSSREIRYEVEVKEISFLPRPRVVTDVTIYDGERPIVRMTDFGMAIVEKPGTICRHPHGNEIAYLGRFTPEGKPVRLNEFQLAHAAKGDLTVPMGSDFDIYRGRHAPYIPNGEFQFVDRMLDINGVRGKLDKGSNMETEYDSPADAWYYRDNSAPFMPNCVLLETSLQASILLGYYLNTTLLAPESDFVIRNLDGRATLKKAIDTRGRTLRHRETLLSTNVTAGAILQNYSYALSVEGEAFYEGESLFGFFTAESLENQVGLDAGKDVPPWIEAQRERAGWQHIATAALATARAGELQLPGGRLRLVEDLMLMADGGKNSLGYIFGERPIRPDDWYFALHFHRDPVMPGSLGIEAMIYGLMAFARETGLAEGFRAPRFAPAVGVEVRWKYRGQIMKENPKMHYELHINEVRKEPGRVTVIASGSLWKERLRIYELHDLAISIEEEAA